MDHPAFKSGNVAVITGAADGIGSGLRRQSGSRLGIGPSS